MKLRTAFVVSLALHAALVLIPSGALLTLDTAGRPAGRPFAVSLFESAGQESAPAAEPAAASPLPSPPEPEPVTAPEPETPAIAPPEPPAPAAASTGTGEAVGSERAPGARPAPPGDGGGGPAPQTQAFYPPQLLAGALPIDPEDSEALNVPERIPVRLRVGTDGQVLEIVPDIPDLPGPVVAALERSARAMRFLPARRGDRAVEAWFSMTFVFRR